MLDLLAISRTLCSVAVSGVMSPTVPDLGMERSGPAPSAFRRAGWRLALREWHRRSTCCYASRRKCSLRRSPPTSGLARRRRGEVRSWTETFLSTPRAAHSGPGPEAVAGRGVCSLRLPPSTSGLTRRWRRRAAQLDGDISFYASRRRLWAWPGGGGGGARGPEFAFLSFTHWPLDGRPSCARSLVPTPSKTVDQTLPPDGMGKAGAFTV